MQAHVGMVADGALNGSPRTHMVEIRRQCHGHGFLLKLLHTALVATAVAHHCLIVDTSQIQRFIFCVLLMQISYNLKMCPANLVRSESFSQFFAKIQIIFQSTKNKVQKIIRTCCINDTTRTYLSRCKATKNILQHQIICQIFGSRGL